MIANAAATPEKRPIPRVPAPRRSRPLADLVHAHGFRVDGPSGRIGTVVGLLFGAWADRPDAIEIRIGLFRTGILVVAAESVAEVRLHNKRVILSHDVDFTDAILSVEEGAVADAVADVTVRAMTEATAD